jgi:hypothetical protein
MCVVDIDFYSALTLKALGFPTEIITVLLRSSSIANWWRNSGPLAEHSVSHDGRLIEKSSAL